MEIQDIIGAAFSATRFEPLDMGDHRPRMSADRLVVEPSALRFLAREAFRSASFYLRRSHLALWAETLEDGRLSENDRIVLETLIRNAAIAAEGALPLCQDTGTAMVIGWKDESVATGARDGEALSLGIAEAYGSFNLRSSQVGALSFFDEFDTRDNLPAQIHIEASEDGTSGPSYRFLFIAKGAGSANKTSLSMLSKALLEERAFDRFLAEKIAALGTAACPPYRLAAVVGGPSPEENLSILKLATTELLDAALPYGPGEEESQARERGWVRRDFYWEGRLMEHARRSGLGAQFGGTSLALDARVLRLPRHAGSCPVSVGVSCSAHRNILAVIDADGLRLEELERKPAAFLCARRGRAAELFGSTPAASVASLPRIDLDRPMAEIRAQLGKLAVGDRMLLSGRLLVARDAAHLRWHALIREGKALPSYLHDHPIYYAGPADTPEGKVIGSFGPTTAQRMDPYGEELMSRGVSLVTLAKGNRAQSWADACAAYGGFYLGTVGGAAALLAEENILESEVLDYEELGMEAVRLIRVDRLMAFLLVNDRGEDLYRRIAERKSSS